MDLGDRETIRARIGKFLETEEGQMVFGLRGVIKRANCPNLYFSNWA